MSILLLAEPMPKDANTWQRIDAANVLHRELEYHARQLIGMAISNGNTSARINAFGPISFCTYFTPVIHVKLQLLPLGNLVKFQPARVPFWLLSDASITGGVWIRDPAQRLELVRELRRWFVTTAWPVEPMIQALSASWGAGSEHYTKMPDQNMSPTGGDMDISPVRSTSGPLLDGRDATPASRQIASPFGV